MCVDVMWGWDGYMLGYWLDWSLSESGFESCSGDIMGDPGMLDPAIGPLNDHSPACQKLPSWLWFLLPSRHPRLCSGYDDAIAAVKNQRVYPILQWQCSRKRSWCMRWAGSLDVVRGPYWRGLRVIMSQLLAYAMARRDSKRAPHLCWV